MNKYHRCNYSLYINMPIGNTHRSEHFILKSFCLLSCLVVSEAFLEISPTKNRVLFTDIILDGSIVNENNRMFSITARSAIECATLCILDEFCQTITFNQRSKLCQGHSTKVTPGASPIVSADSHVYQVITPCK